MNCLCSKCSEWFTLTSFFFNINLFILIDTLTSFDFFQEVFCFVLVKTKNICFEYKMYMYNINAKYHWIGDLRHKQSFEMPI